jgi:outer membrane lipoprotein SlyB
MPNLDDAPREVANTLKAAPGAQYRKMHPMIIIAAGAVTLFSAVGIAVMTGIIPSAHSVADKTTEKAQPSGMPTTPAAAGAATAAIGSASEAALPSTPAKPIESGTMGQPLARADARAEAQGQTQVPTQAQAPKPAPKPVAAAPKPVAPKPAVVAQASPPAVAPGPVPGSATERGPSAPRMEEVPTPVYAQNGAPRAAAPVVCASCGTVDGIFPIEQAGQGSGAGAVLGGVVGGVLGHQVGKGRGRDVATVAGAVGGAVLGNQIEKGTKTTRSFDVRVRMEDGTFQTVRSDVEPNVRVGDKVRIENGRVVR